ncbi:MAG: LysR family transcriptional regulator [Chloroflexi bacterium]|nr:LysR family transcriptional regulator [Chloroflexota bacterium]
MDWDRLRIFHAVAKAGSFTRGGRVLNLSQSAVSRQVSTLEDELGAPLFHRHARGLILTEQGDVLYQTTQDMTSKLAATQSSLSDSTEQPMGEIRVTATVGFGSTWLTPRIHEFLEHYPDVTVSLVVDDRELDLAMREADVAIRMRPSVHPGLLQRKLLTFHTHLYASPSYLQRYGLPTKPDDLDQHRLITWADEAPAPVEDTNWILDISGRDGVNRPVFSVNNSFGILLAVESGLGIATLPDYMVRSNDKLQRVLSDLDGPAYDTYIVYPEELRNSARINIFRDFLLAKVAEWEF